MNEYV